MAMQLSLEDAKSVLTPFCSETKMGSKEPFYLSDHNCASNGNSFIAVQTDGEQFAEDAKFTKEMESAKSNFLGKINFIFSEHIDINDFLQWCGPAEGETKCSECKDGKIKCDNCEGNGRLHVYCKTCGDLHLCESCPKCTDGEIKCKQCKGAGTYTPIKIGKIGDNHFDLTAVSEALKAAIAIATGDQTDDIKGSMMISKEKMLVIDGPSWRVMQMFYLIDSDDDEDAIVEWNVTPIPNPPARKLQT